MKNRKVITYPQALKLIEKNVFPLSRQTVALSDANGYVLAEPIMARHHFPLFDQSAMDGFGVKVADVKDASETSPVKLKLAGTVQAGDAHTPKIKNGEAIKTLTGGRVVPGVEGIAIREVCEERDGYVYVKRAIKKNQHVRFVGEEYKKGTVAMQAGGRITPPVVGLLATMGYAKVKVHRLPRVALITTGNELIDPGKPLKRGQIYDSNSYALIAALQQLGIHEIQTFRLKDNRAALQKSFSQALKSADVVISVGGVSVGDYDFVKDVLEALKVKTVFWRLKIKPGKPNYFGTRGTRSVSIDSQKIAAPKNLVFGLPGNPVSALVSYHQLIKPALLRLIGLKKHKALLATAPILSPLKKGAGRLEWVRGKLLNAKGRLAVQPTKGQGSHMLGGLAHANCLIEFGLNDIELNKGDEAKILPLNWDE